MRNLRKLVVEYKNTKVEIKENIRTIKGGGVVSSILTLELQEVMGNSEANAGGHSMEDVLKPTREMDRDIRRIGIKSWRIG